MRRLVAATAIALVGVLVAASAASAHTLTVRRAVQNTRAVANDINRRAANDGMRLANVHIGACTRLSAHSITCRLSYTRQPAGTPPVADAPVCRRSVRTTFAGPSSYAIRTAVSRPRCTGFGRHSE